MLTFLARALSGARSVNYFYTQSLHCIALETLVGLADNLNGEREIRAFFEDNNERLELWEAKIKPICADIAFGGSRQQQLLKTRQATLTEIELLEKYAYLLDNKLSPEQQKLVFKVAMPRQLNVENGLEKAWLEHMLSKCTYRCLRKISGLLGDTRQNDWADMYAHFYRRAIEAEYKAILRTTEKPQPVSEEIDFPGRAAFLQTMQHAATVGAAQNAEEVREKALQGENWDFAGFLESQNKKAA